MQEKFCTSVMALGFGILREINQSFEDMLGQRDLKSMYSDQKSPHSSKQAKPR